MCLSQTIKAFEESNRMYAIPAETASQGQPFEKENLPGPGTCYLVSCISNSSAPSLAGAKSRDLEQCMSGFFCSQKACSRIDAKLTDVSTDALQTQVGSKDGQQLFIRENDGSVTAHLWSSSTSQWNLVCIIIGYWRPT